MWPESDAQDSKTHVSDHASQFFMLECSAEYEGDHQISVKSHQSLTTFLHLNAATKLRLLQASDHQHFMKAATIFNTQEFHSKVFYKYFHDMSWLIICVSILSCIRCWGRCSNSFRESWEFSVWSKLPQCLRFNFKDLISPASHNFKDDFINAFPFFVH